MRPHGKNFIIFLTIFPLFFLPNKKFARARALRKHALYDALHTDALRTLDERNISCANLLRERLPARARVRKGADFFRGESGSERGGNSRACSLPYQKYDVRFLYGIAHHFVVLCLAKDSKF